MQSHNALITTDHLRAAMNLPGFDPASAQEHMAPSPRGILAQDQDVPPREAGVLALIFPEYDGNLHLVLTRRTESLRKHSGQISLPGGQRDLRDESLMHTALRETCEELGICEGIEVLGALNAFYIPPSHFMVFPSVAMMQQRPVFKPNPAEVAEVFSFPLHDLINAQHKHQEFHTYNGVHVRIPYYLVNGHKVWGATAVILSEFEQRLHCVL